MKRLLPILALLLLAGCHRSPGVVGRWSGDTTTGPGMSEATDVIFSDDGHVTWTIGPVGRQLVATGTYTLSGDMLSQHPSSGMLNGHPIPTSGPLPSENYRFNISKDTLTLDRQGMPTRVILKRVP